MSNYGNTGNTTITGITPAQQANFDRDLPAAYRGVGQQVVVGPNGTEQTPTSSVVIAPGGTHYSYDFTGVSYVLAGSDASLNLTTSNHPGGQPARINLTTSGYDTVRLNHGPDFVQDTGGHNHFIANGGNDTISSFGHNLIDAHGMTNVIYGAQQDTINLGTSQNDVVDAGYGRETVNGGLNATITGYGHTSISGGINNTINLTGSDTLAGVVSNRFAAKNSGATVATNDTVNVAANSSVFINGKDVPGNSGDQTPTGINVNIAAGTSGHDTIFGAGNHNLTINASALGSYTDGTNTTGNPSIHVLNFSSGDTLYVNNVTVIDTKGTHPV